LLNLHKLEKKEENKRMKQNNRITKKKIETIEKPEKKNRG
jgi:hypothetical protein